MNTEITRNQAGELSLFQELQLLDAVGIYEEAKWKEGGSKQRSDYCIGNSHGVTRFVGIDACTSSCTTEANGAVIPGCSC